MMTEKERHKSNMIIAKNFMMLAIAPTWLLPNAISQEEYDALYEKYFDNPRYD